MMDFLRHSSKKLWVVISAAIVLLLKDAFGLSPETAQELTAVAGAYLLGQGIADMNKHKPGG